MTKSEQAALEGLSISIRSMRKAEKWSQKDLAERLGVSTAFVNHLEQGNRYPSIETLFKIARAFSVPVEKLLKEPKKRSVRPSGKKV